MNKKWYFLAGLLGVLAIVGVLILVAYSVKGGLLWSEHT